MSVNRLEERFRTTQAAKRGALVPYFTSGYPDTDVTTELIRQADALGATAIEIGVPYSDSIADGPVIQDSYNYVLERGQRVEDTLNLVSRVRSSVNCGLVAMVSYSLVHRYGVDAFMHRAAAAGFDGVILPDVPVEESGPMSAAAQANGLCHIGLIAPTTAPARREAVARASSGFIYQIAVAGTTGERRSLPTSLPDEVAQLRVLSGLPVCVGFGISTAEQVRAVCGFADGAIVGSAIVRRIGETLRQGMKPDELIESVSGFLSQLTAGAESGTH